MKPQGSAGCPVRASVVALSLVLWGALPGCADPGITVTLAAWPPGAQQLVVHPSLDGRVGTDIVLPAEQGSFVVRVPGLAECWSMVRLQRRGTCGTALPDAA